MTLAIASVLSRRAVRRDVAMTGEVTLRGKALEIGGVKEKVLAAYRAGLREVILPKTNEKDLRDVPDEVRANMVFTFVTTMDDVFRIALLDGPPRGLQRDARGARRSPAQGRGTACASSRLDASGAANRQQALTGDAADVGASRQ